MHTDILGHPIEPGVTVLTNRYQSSSMGEITTVDRITKKAVIVTINATWYSWDSVTRKYTRHSGRKTIRKRPGQVIVIDKQLKHNQKEYPENMI